MNACPREPEVVDAVMRGNWQQAPEALRELRAHAASCAACGELVTLAQALREDHAVVCRAADVPAAGTVWWRATIRARAEAAEKAVRPITFAQGLAGASLAGVAAAFAGIAWRTFPSLPQPDPLVMLALGLGVCIVIAPLVLVFALARD
ncbi:MAG: hypothetical protein HY047_10895 [Acidobacteria bacterium]|nr:hypothetical protein [Acidobacteriota bacterium]